MWIQHDIPFFNIMEICDLNMFIHIRLEWSTMIIHDTVVLPMTQKNYSKFHMFPAHKYYVVDSGYPNNIKIWLHIDLHETSL